MEVGAGPTPVGEENDLGRKKHRDETEEHLASMYSMVESYSDMGQIAQDVSIS